ncbi:MAG: YIP1 family protein [Saprospiraceae bacterium]|nr:YIP1 family protein [Saprospiraceae bacterium]
MYIDEDLQAAPVPLQLTDKEVFTGMWTEPGTVFRFIHETQYDKYGSTLLVLGGISRALDRAYSSQLGNDMPLWGILGLCIVLGGSLGWVAYYLYAALIAWTGRLLNGVANTKDVFRVMTYAIVPTVVTLVLLTVQIILLGESMFKSDMVYAGLDRTTRELIMWTRWLEVVLAFWFFVLLAIGVAEIQKFNHAKAVLNLLYPFLVLGLPVVWLMTLLRG